MGMYFGVALFCTVLVWINEIVMRGVFCENKQ